jgi:hypothetical protein
MLEAPPMSGYYHQGAQGPSPKCLLPLIEDMYSYRDSPPRFYANTLRTQPQQQRDISILWHGKECAQRHLNHNTQHGMKQPLTFIRPAHIVADRWHYYHHQNRKPPIADTAKPLRPYRQVPRRVSCEQLLLPRPVLM